MGKRRVFMCVCMYTYYTVLCILQEGFYCMKRLGDRFPSMQTVMSYTSRPYSPVFLCMFVIPLGDTQSDIRTPREYHMFKVEKKNCLICLVVFFCN